MSSVEIQSHRAESEAKASAGAIIVATIVDRRGSQVGRVEADGGDLSLRIVANSSEWEPFLLQRDFSPLTLDADQVLRIETGQPVPAEQRTDDLDFRLHELSNGALRLSYLDDGIDAYSVAECELNLHESREPATPFPRNLPAS